MNNCKAAPSLWIVVPCYNEEAVLPETAPLFAEAISRMIKKDLVSSNSRVCFVDDGSSDGTWELIERLSKEDAVFEGIKLSRNRGHQNALLCGLMEARSCCDITISIDCDGQDDISAMDEMVEEYLRGSEIVYGIRNERETDTAFKRITAEGYYKTLAKMGVESVFNHADYRLMSRCALDALAEFPEVNIYLRGMVPQLGYKTSQVFYRRAERIAGESHYPLTKMLKLAVDGITSLSIQPIRLITGSGTLIGLVGLVGIIWAGLSFLLGNTVSGWASTICIILFLGGVQLLSLGVIGEYVGKMYLETKRRPRYIVESLTWR